MHQEIEASYCEHFQHLKSIKKISIPQQSFCKFCLSTNCSLWLCLYKNCGQLVCSKSNYCHLSSHMQCKIVINQESKRTKSFHSIFINIYTAQIRCQYCGIQILDIDQLSEDHRKQILLNSNSNNPLKFRYAILPFLEQLGQPKSNFCIKNKVMGQLQYPEGHRKINKGLVGIFPDRINYSLIPAIQFIVHCGFFKDIILAIKLKQNHGNRSMTILNELIQITQSIQNAHQRAIRIQKLMDLMIKRQPKLYGYKRKDPFQSILELLNILHEHLNFYRVTNVLSNFGKDQWDLFYRPKQIQSHCPIYDSLASTLSLDYKCSNSECNHEEDYSHQINFIKLQFPKKKRKTKVIQQELNDRGYQSPRKRGKSLMSFILPEEDLPITIPQLLIQFFKQPFHKQKYCPKCKNTQIPMKAGKVQFNKISDILILQINRFPKTTDQMIDTQVILTYENLNLSPFLIDKKRHKKDKESDQKAIQYEFVTAVGIENGFFSVICRSKYNNQLYVIKNESVQMLSKKHKINPYIICLKKVTSTKTQQFYQEIVNQNQIILSSSTKIDNNKLPSTLPLPDFYHIQLKHGIQLPVYQPLVCKHSRLKPFIERKCQENIVITEKMYGHLIETFKGVQFVNQICKECQQEVQLIKERKSKEKQLIKEYDGYKTNANVMISMAWLKKWSNYLYSNQTPSYMHKGYPLPPSMDNTCLLQNNKCKTDLVKNRDFKIINIFVFKLLKQLYSGGPQIRYKWKNNELTSIDEGKIRQIKLQAGEIKQIYSPANPQSPKKSVILEKNSSYMQTVNETQLEDNFQLQELPQ